MGGFLRFVALKEEDIEGALSLQVIDRRIPIGSFMNTNVPPTTLPVGNAQCAATPGGCSECSSCAAANAAAASYMDPWDEFTKEENWDSTFEVLDLYRPLQDYLEGMQAITEQPDALCRDYRMLFNNYFSFFHYHAKDVQQLLMSALHGRNGTSLFDDW